MEDVTDDFFGTLITDAYPPPDYSPIQVNTTFLNVEFPFTSDSDPDVTIRYNISTDVLFADGDTPPDLEDLALVFVQASMEDYIIDYIYEAFVEPTSVWFTLNSAGYQLQIEVYE